MLEYNFNIEVSIDSPVIDVPYHSIVPIDIGLGEEIKSSYLDNFKKRMKISLRKLKDTIKQLHQKDIINLSLYLETIY